LEKDNKAEEEFVKVPNRIILELCWLLLSYSFTPQFDI